MQKIGASKINEFVLLGVKEIEKNILRSYIIGFVNTSYNIDDNCPHNLTPCGVAGRSEQIENVQEYFNNVYQYIFILY